VDCIDEERNIDGLAILTSGTGVDDVSERASITCMQSHSPKYYDYSDSRRLVSLHGLPELQQQEEHRDTGAESSDTQLSNLLTN
jgi:hypothetical protein